MGMRTLFIITAFLLSTLTAQADSYALIEDLREIFSKTKLTQEEKELGLKHVLATNESISGAEDTVYSTILATLSESEKRSFTDPVHVSELEDSHYLDEIKMRLIQSLKDNASSACVADEDALDKTSILLFCKNGSFAQEIKIFSHYFKTKRNPVPKTVTPRIRITTQAKSLREKTPLLTRETLFNFSNEKIKVSGNLIRLVFFIENGPVSEDRIRKTITEAYLKHPVRVTKLIKEEPTYIAPQSKDVRAFSILVDQPLDTCR